MTRQNPVRETSGLGTVAGDRIDGLPSIQKRSAVSPRRRWRFKYAKLSWDLVDFDKYKPRRSVGSSHLGSVAAWIERDE